MRSRSTRPFARRSSGPSWRGTAGGRGPHPPGTRPRGARRRALRSAELRARYGDPIERLAARLALDGVPPRPSRITAVLPPRKSRPAWPRPKAHLLPTRPRSSTRRLCVSGSRVSPQADIGLVGLAVMGQNLVLNMPTTATASPSSTGRPRRSTPFRRPAAGTSGSRHASLAELAAVFAGPRRDADGPGGRGGGRHHLTAFPTSSLAT